MTTVRCPMLECRRRVDLDDFEAIPVPPAQPAQRAQPPCLHFLAAWGGRRGGMAEAVLWGLAGNREFMGRNLRPRDVRPERIEEVRPHLEQAARQFAHVVPAEAVAAPRSPEDASTLPEAALFADRHEANHVAREYARWLLGE